MVVKHSKMDPAALFSALLLLFALPAPSPAQDVRAVDHYISDTAPVAGIGVGEVVPARAPLVPPPADPPRISKETERTVSYVEDVLAGRVDAPEGGASIETVEERRRPVTTTGYSRVDAPVLSEGAGHGGGTRDAAAPAYSRDDHGRPDGGARTSGDLARDSGTGYTRDDAAAPPRVVPHHSEPPRRAATAEGVRTSAGAPRDGTDAQRDRGEEERRSPAGSSRGGGPVYAPEERAPVAEVAPQGSYHSGSGRKDLRDPAVATPHRDAPSNPPRDSTPGRVASSDYSRDRVHENSRESSRDDAYEYARGDAVDDYSRDGVVGDSQGGGAYDTPRRPAVGQPQGTGHSRDTSVEHSRDASVEHSRDTSVEHSRDMSVEHSRDASVEHSRDMSVEHSRDASVDHSRGTAVDRRPVGGHSSGDVEATAEVDHRREPAAVNSWETPDDGEKSERDSELVRPGEHPRGGDPVEEAIYTSKAAEDLESSFGFDREEEDEDIDVARSSRPLLKTQRPRQVSGDRRGARGPHPSSPCPSVFSYEGTRAGKERWYGVVLVTTDETLTGLRLEVVLDKRADLLGTWLGEVSSVDNIRYTIWNGRRKVEPGPPLSVKIFVKYNDQEYEPPRVRTIRLNGRQICPKEKGTPVAVPMPSVKPPTRPNQQVTRPVQRPTRPVQRPTRPANAGVQNSNRPQVTKRPQQKPVQSSDQSMGGTELVDGVACGRIEVQPSPLITYGQRTARGQWPWHAAIYQSKGTDLSYICGGSLVGKRTILTAAHCVSRRYIDRPVDPESLVVYLGKYHLKLWSEGGVQDKQVLEVHVHPEYNSTDFRADIAILILSSAVEFTLYVKPICLWDRHRPNLNEVQGHEGVVVGWGYDERGMVTEDLMMAKMPVVSQQDCLWSYPQFFSHFTSDRTYCAGFRNGTSVCNGDSGGGMVFPKTTGVGPHGNTVTWALRGIVSLSTSQANKRVCNTDHYVVFTDVVKFYDWMNKYH